MKKIAVMGPESTGKSSMAKSLALHYGTVWVPEFAREYCENLKGPANLQDEENILIGQIALEKDYSTRAKDLLICDTMFLTVKIYSNHVFGEYPSALDAYLQKNLYDFFLIMDIDLPWEDDPLREFPDLRAYFLDIHIQEIKALKVPYALVSGIGEERTQRGIYLVDQFLKKNL